MREIKFRAWDPKNRVMIDSCGFRDSDSGRYYLRELYMVDEDNTVGTDWFLMQFTGLIDKNGKEIYEGDCVTFRDRRFFVKWYRYKWQFFNKVGGQPVSQIVNHIQKEGEIIGNIYENPELLK